MTSENEGTSNFVILGPLSLHVEGWGWLSLTVGSNIPSTNLTQSFPTSSDFFKIISYPTAETATAVFGFKFWDDAWKGHESSMFMTPEDTQIY